ncbi:hypothetical protein Asppvi_005474 [Aspergillus pseudoviridinutans]|uniref:GPI anchored cell wall protein n=1 Tax=Aspergillus pseudoviridinutans TaxID=1517512 RepID=A0A9P3BAX7_9EURO|nr:uncharacterized protein Asppvi_005474 [Aspergillus pseudoviridinutans]GIJ86584.1 hypothetical protein Asppvi_005474 [Aspergillus pseudoviridinutans]
MFFPKILFPAAFALTVSALPQFYPGGSMTRLGATATSSASISTTSTSASTSVSPSATTSSSRGSVKILNNLGSTVYLWSTSDTSSAMQTIASGETYSETYQTNSDGGGISIKMATTESQASVLQFEYTKDSDTLYWDLSAIDMDSDSKFITAGFSATPSDSSCSSVTCTAGDSDCSEVYHESDDVATQSCSATAGITVTLG